MTRRDVLELGAMAGAMTLPGFPAFPTEADEARFWADIAETFPPSFGLINLLHTGGGACPRATLDQIAHYQRIAVNRH